MSKIQDIARLHSIAGLVLDVKLAGLRNIARARDETVTRLAGLTPAAMILEDRGGVADVLAAIAYQRWADARRAELNQTLARQTAAWMDARDNARTAFGKADVLQSLGAQSRAARAQDLRRK